MLIDVKSVIAGTWEPKTLVDAMEGFVVLQGLQDEVNKGKDNAWGFVFTIGRNVYADFFQKKEGMNDASVPWYQMAAEAFQSDIDKAILIGETRGLNARGIANFKNATQTIHKAMENGADLLERDNATGNFVLSSKNKVEKWNKDFDTKAKEAAREKRRQEMVKSGQLPALVESKGAAQATEEGNQVADIFADLDGNLAELLRTYVDTVVSMSKQAASLPDKKTGVVETGTQKAMRLIQGDLARLQGIFIHDFAALQKAANG